ncbi:MAG: Fic family protein [Geobacter sp.]|nr:Fic family protein [Geobacter sp.]
MSYQPPFTITSSIASLIADISQRIGHLSALESAARTLNLRRINRIRTIQGSLAIEGNTLSQEQITAILEGKRVIAPPREIQEVRNAIKAYDLFEQWQPGAKKDLLAAHQMLMSGLLDELGQFRSGGVGVMAGQNVVHLPPPANRVPELMHDLLRWLETTTEHPLIASSVFHYEFEFIHPFADGNGRMGRLWQTLILSKWNPLFAHIPVESLVHQHQQEYYAALNASTQQADSAVFIEFMLSMVLKAVTTSDTPQVAPQVTPQVERLLKALVGELSREKIQNALGLHDRKSFRELYLAPALASGLIEMTIPEKPNSRLQQYRLTDQGLEWLSARKEKRR